MSVFGSGRREGLIAVLVLLLLAIALHAPGLFMHSYRSPQQLQYAGGGSFEAHTNQATLMPALRAAAITTDRGDAPMWNPTARLGEPFLSSGAPVMYPPFWLLIVRGGSEMLEVLLCLHTFLACMFMYRFCRVLPLSRYVSFIAGALYGFGWFFTAQLDRLPHAAAAAIVPLALEFTWRVLVSNRRLTYAAWLSIVGTLMLSTGGTDTAVLGLILCCLLFCYGACALDAENRRLALRGIAVTGVLTLLLTCPLWIHWLSHINSIEPASSVGIPHLQPAGLIAAVAPNAFGGLAPASTEALRMINPGADPLELILFPGSIVLFLAVLGLLRPKRTSQGLFWIAIGGLGLVLSIDSPITTALANQSALFSTSPGAGLIFVHVAFVVLAAAALESFFEAPVARPLALPIAAGIVFGVAATTFVCGFVFTSVGRDFTSLLTQESLGPKELQQTLNHLRFAILPTILFSSAIAGLFLAWRRMGMIRFKVALEPLVIVELFLVALCHTPRSSSPPAEHDLSARIPDGTGRVIVAGRDQAVHTAPLRSDGISTITTTAPVILSRTRDYLTLIDHSMVQVNHLARVLPIQNIATINDRLLDVAGVGVAVTRVSGTLARGFSTLAPTPTFESKKDPIHILFRTEPTSRVRILFQEVHAKSRADAVAQLQRHADDLHETVILEGVPDGFASKRPGVEPTISFIEDKANSVALQVDMGQGRGYLLLADAFAPGWRALIDGQPTTIYPANVAMRAVQVPEGAHEIRFVYAPLTLRIGVPVASFGLILFLAWLFQVWRWNRASAKRRDGASAWA